jgi:tRNA (Thr-GGU) A37 N-methylase
MVHQTFSEDSVSQEAAVEGVDPFSHIEVLRCFHDTERCSIGIRILPARGIVVNYSLGLTSKMRSYRRLG